MTAISDLLPIRLTWRERPTGKHREDDAVDLLQCKLASARLLIKGLCLQLDDKDREHEETVARLDERYGATIRQLETELADARSRLEVRNWADSVVTQTQEIPVEEVLRHCTPVPLHQSPMARRDPAHVPAWAQRDEPEPAA
ncbi:hypothetical protein [Streptomyces europaeiscabiei]|uniref:hypothetical protein n=1 Tax=Streptomyces europaeiscabiei TaxID=146819 RepID=UPI0029A25CF5|nr:hypothetical protein [Streptomyces europaeiscabiei]MDX2761614.1 hypothetical protein [Streptomyces europaeiscabiei]